LKFVETKFREPKLREAKQIFPNGFNLCEKQKQKKELKKNPTSL
jgi:hypothetical protein